MSDSTEVKIARIEEQQKALKSVVDEIKDNHLVHLSADIKDTSTAVDRLSNKMAYWGGGLAVILFLLQLAEIYFSFHK